MGKRKYKTPPPWLVVGAIVDYHAVIGEPATMLRARVRQGPWQLGHGAWVASIEGKAGGCLVEALTLSVPQ